VTENPIPIALLPQLLAAMAEGVVVQERSGAIVFANESATRILGLSRDELSGRVSTTRPWRAVFADGTQVDAQNHPALVTLATGCPQRGVLMRVWGTPDEPRWLRINTEPILDGTGTPTHAVATLTDVTSQLATEQELAEQVTMFRQIATNAPVVVCLCDASGALRFINPAWTRLSGQPTAEALGNGWLTMLDPDDAACHYGAWVDASAAARRFHRDTQLLCTSGEVRPVRVDLAPYHDADGAVVGWVGVVLDLADRVSQPGTARSSAAA
jgi:PAS domain S-box-containing protein